jgi:hypothetical protein
MVWRGNSRDLVPHGRDSIDMAALAEVSLEEIELWLCTCLESVEAPNTPLNEWEIEFVKSVDFQYVTRVNRGFTSPLTLKQLARLQMLFNKLADATAKMMQRSMKDL